MSGSRTERSLSRIVVIGGGISGLACARALLDLAGLAGQAGRQGVEVTVLEAAPVAGGPVRSERSDGFVVEAGPHGFLNADPSTAALARRLGLGDRLLPADEGHRGRFIFHGGRLHRFPAGPLRLLTSQLLTVRGRARLFTEPLRAGGAQAHRPDGPDGIDEPDESVGAFARRRLGDEVAERLVDPLVCGVYGGDMDRLSLSSTAPQLAAQIRAGQSVLRSMLRMSGPRRPAHKGTRPSGPPRQLVSFAGGIGELTEALAASLGSSLECRTPVTAVRRIEAGAPRATGERWRISVAGEHPREFDADAVVAAVPAPAARSLLGPLDIDLDATLASITHLPDVVVALGFRAEDVAHPLDGFGYLVPRAEGGCVLGVLWSSSMFPGHRSPPGTVLMQAILGGMRQLDACDQSDEWLESQVMAQLRAAVGVRAAPIFRRVMRHRPGLPQYEVGHRERVARAEAAEQRHPGLFITGNAWRGVGINACTSEAARVAKRVLEHVGVSGSGRASPVGVAAS